MVEPAPGIARAMNCGHEIAEGEVIAYLHSDDRYADKQVLERVAASFRDNPGTLWVTGGLREIDEQGGTVRELPALNFTKKRLLRNNIIYHPATFVKSDTLKALGGFDESLRYAMDYDLWLRLADFSAPFHCDGILADFRVHSGSRSSAERDKALEEEYRVRRHHLGGGSLGWQHACYQWLRTHYEKWMAG
jgi:glycosyltransferase involved in cell wall biosynthesis